MHVARWINEIEAKCAAAEARIKKSARRRRITEEEIMPLAAEIGPFIEALNQGSA